jgi:glutamate dehydrogenase (NADP+)
VSWEDDEGNARVNRGTRVQFNNAIGPYKGGIRFHPSVTLSVLKFLAFEQTFKNSLTTLPLGGAKGGANFNPKGKSDREIMRFCQAFMTQLWRHIGASTDIPAGDIGVGVREVSYLFGQYKRLAGEFTGAITGKGLAFGGSLIRTEATGYGNVYLTREMLARVGDDLEGKRCLVSGSGNVAQYTVEKATELGGCVVTLSDSSGFIHDPDGIDAEKLAWVMELKNERRGRISEYADHFGCDFFEDQRPWGIPADIAFPSATENEIDGDDAATMLDNGVRVVSEGSNMPSTVQAMHRFRDARILYAPSKAANAGGVAVSGLEQSQNAMRLQWTRDEVDERLQSIMHQIHEQCVEFGADGDHVDYVRGANLAGFVKVADAMVSHGLV